jgi:hypothetical protein
VPARPSAPLTTVPHPPGRRPAAAGISLEPRAAGSDADVALYRDARVGFSHLLPGRPRLFAVDYAPNELACDACIEIEDAPVTIRYRLDVETKEAALPIATRIAAWRAQARVVAETAHPSWPRTWGAEDAAVASYDVAHARDPDDEPLREDLFVLTRREQRYVVTWSYPARAASTPPYGAFASIAEATIVWDPERYEQRGRVWPKSNVASPGLSPALDPRLLGTVHTIARTAQREALKKSVARVLASAGPPWIVLSPDTVHAHRDEIVDVARGEEALVHRLFESVRTAHDLRAIAVFIGRALNAKSGEHVRQR